MATKIASGRCVSASHPHCCAERNEDTDMERETLKRILECHQDWLHGKNTGKRANLSRVVLSGVDLSGADLRGADLIGVELSEANLSGAQLGPAKWEGCSEEDEELEPICRARSSVAPI